MTTQKERLGQLIFDENPYTREAAAQAVQTAGDQAGTAAANFLSNSGGTALPTTGSEQPPTFQEILKAFHRAIQEQVILVEPGQPQAEIEIERDYQTTEWYFKGRNRSVARAIRIPYCFRDAFGRMVEEHILVGFEGSGEYG